MWAEPGTGSYRAYSGVSALIPAFPQEIGEVADDLRSYESTRCLPWPANSFMVSVTDPVGVLSGVLGPLRVNRT
ncbi:hypothetical protein GQF42_33315 [Streptomyces broussonetiae]|uniref:Uncharacterized protein n=1 Tax=Streptomyces broussonetiae TaxID=2686304 RepID=A0A6I6N840_9ACTN|nr:hypothetical protein GQF42_33315 [Streptomyces broussonetiae]